MRRLHCRTLVPPPVYCFWKRYRDLDCCPRGGSSGSAGSGGFAHNDFAALGFHQRASGSENVGGGGGGGGGGGPGSVFNPSVEPDICHPHMLQVPSLARDSQVYCRWLSVSSAGGADVGRQTGISRT